MVQCVDDGRYHNPDWNAELADGAEFLPIERNAETLSTRTTIRPHQLEVDCGIRT